MHLCVGIGNEGLGHTAAAQLILHLPFGRAGKTRRHAAVNDYGLRLALTRRELLGVTSIRYDGSRHLLIMVFCGDHTRVFTRLLRSSQTMHRLGCR